MKIPLGQSQHGVLLGALILLAMAAPEVSAGDPLFESNAVLEVTLIGPFGALSRDRKDVPDLHPGQLTFTDAEGAQKTLSVSLEPRGKSRRDRAVCTFPPLWVHFDKAEVKETLFEKQNKLKLVTYCRSPENFQDYVIKEYLVYRIFNELSDASFRVRLAKIAFAEDASQRRPLARYGFFIEHKKRLGKRLDMKVVEPAARIPAAALVPEQATIAELFQFMVSNTDFSFIAPPEDDTCCHNAVLLDAGEERYLPVPYDFDRTGLVSPPNGLPAEGLGQRSFRDRVFRGFCRDAGYMEAAIRRTLDARSAIEAVIAGQPGLGERSRKRALDYLASYYQVIEDPKRRDRALKCRDVP